MNANIPYIKILPKFSTLFMIIIAPITANVSKVQLQAIDLISYGGSII